ncbi:MAG: Holliday junction branch migration protein RuvA [Gammaproteobacteria bacterium]|nr:Holliday junction branch migration protein RuvA [Gammaproteobacteria bacterium]
MIGLIRGIILEKQPPQLIVDVQGLGYEVDAPMSTFYHLPDVGTEVTLYTHFVVREDAHLLFGFYTQDERVLFRTLLKVNGVGPRLALAILSSITSDEFVRMVLNNDSGSLVKLPGVGKKTAERLIIEMRDKLSNWYQAENKALPLDALTPTNTRHSILQDAISALVSLGYKQQEANRTVTKVDNGYAASEELIRLALREIM